MKDSALRYEYVIRKAHKVDRLEIAAAYADAYSALEKNYIRHRDNIDDSKREEFLFEYAFFCGEIATNLNNALDAFEKNYKLTEQDREEIRMIEELLIYPRMNEIENALIHFENILKRHKLII